MSTQVRETAAGKSISAYVVLNKKGEHVATVNSHYSNGGRVTVDVWNHGSAADRCLAAAAKCGALTPAQLDKAEAASRAKRDWCQPEEHARFAAYDLYGMQQSGAGGYGYDKFAAAIAGLWIDGQQLGDHCGSVANAQKAKDALMRAYVKEMSGDFLKRSTQKYWDAKADKLGARFANWSSDRGAYTSLHFIAGLERLEKLGYRVISAI